MREEKRGEGMGGEDGDDATGVCADTRKEPTDCLRSFNKKTHQEDYASQQTKRGERVLEKRKGGVSVTVSGWFECT